MLFKEDKDKDKIKQLQKELKENVGHIELIKLIENVGLSSEEEIIDTYENKDKSTINTNDFAGSLDNLITKKKFFIVETTSSPILV